MFKYSDKVKFPVAIESGSGSSVLVETFVEGMPITYYESHPHMLNKVIARIGATTFFEMLMKNNFIHADCHGGNIMVRILEKSTGAVE
jgi:aarF domain-containing kinase